MNSALLGLFRTACGPSVEVPIAPSNRAPGGVGRTGAAWGGLSAWSAQPHAPDLNLIERVVFHSWPSKVAQFAKVARELTGR